MNYYHIWCNLKDSHNDMEFAANLNRYLGRLKSLGKIAGFQLTRRKLGFGPAELGEFHIVISADNLVQLESAFDLVSQRRGEIETIHSRVYSMVTDFKAALYRDFPDPNRMPQESAVAPVG